MRKLYFFKSSYPNDEVNNVNVFAPSLRKAFSYVFKTFAKHNCKGIPMMIAI